MEHGQALGYAVPHVGVKTPPGSKDPPCAPWLLPRLLAGPSFVEVPGMGGLAKIQPAGASCLPEVEGPPTQFPVWDTQHHAPDS